MFLQDADRDQGMLHSISLSVTQSADANTFKYKVETLNPSYAPFYNIKYVIQKLKSVWAFH